MTHTKPSLSDRDYKLLSKFFDGECGYFEYRRAKRLVEDLQGGADYLALLDKLAVGVKSGKSDLPGRLENMWERVSARIEAEERSQILLGKRASAGAGYEFWPRVFSKFGLDNLPAFLQARGFGLSALVVAASLLLFVVSPYGRLAGSGSNYTKDVSAPGSNVSGFGFLPASAKAPESGAESFARPQIIEDDYQRALEVDWVRSPGRVKFIQSPRERSAIIWVRRREPRVGTFAAAAPEVKPTAFFESDAARQSE